MSALSFLSVCSGIEAASVAWEPLGWQAVAFSEIEAFPSAVLAHHWPHIPNLGDFTAIDVDALPHLDLLVGGTPCQAFSFAGNRRSLADARGNLSLAYVRLAHELADRRSLRQAVWENVPGVLSTDDNAFGCFLGALVGADDPLPQPFGERWPDAGLVAGPRARAAWRVLDAQYFGLAQRRRRVFVVVDFGGGADPAAVLFERQGLRRNPPSRGEAGQGVAGTLAGGARERGGFSYDDVPLAYAERGQSDYALGNPTLRAKGGEAAGGSEALLAFGGGNRSGPVEVAATLTARGHKCDFEVETFLAFDCKAGGNTGFSIGDLAGALRGEGHGGGHAAVAYAPEIAGTLVARSSRGGGQTNSPGYNADEQVVVEPYTLAIRGRVDGHHLEFRQDGTANALLTPNGGRAGIGVGAIAYGITRDAIDRSGEGADASAGARSGLGIDEELSPTLKAKGPNAVAYGIRADAGRDGVAKTPSADAEGRVRLRDPGFNVYPEMATTLDASAKHAVGTSSAVRRLTPTECERLQGFPDGHTAIVYRGKPAADGPRYKALGNSKAVPVVRWIGARIAANWPAQIAEAAE